LESADYQAPWYDDTGWLHRPDVHGGELAGALMSGLIAPQSPSETRWDTLWMYMQGGPGVFKGDLFFYRADGDFRDRVGAIDTRACPLYLLTRDYDFSCTPATRSPKRSRVIQATAMPCIDSTHARSDSSRGSDSTSQSRGPYKTGTASSGSERRTAIGRSPASSSRRRESSPTHNAAPPRRSAHASTTEPFGTRARRRTISSPSAMKYR